MQYSELINYILSFVSKSALVLLIIPMSGSGVVIEVYSADIGTHSLYSKIVSKLALVLLLNTNERFRVVVEEYSTVFGTCLLYSQNRIKSIELVRRSGFRQGYG